MSEAARTHRRLRLVGLVLSIGLLWVSLLPWWQRRVAFADAGGERIVVFTADVWHASTGASIGLLVAVLVVANLTFMIDSAVGFRVQGLVLAVVGWSPVLLMIGAAFRAWHAAHASAQTTVTIAVNSPVDYRSTYRIARDHLQFTSLSGYQEGPGWGAGLGLFLMLVAAVWATRRALQPGR